MSKICKVDSKLWHFKLFQWWNLPLRQVIPSDSLNQCHHNYKSKRANRLSALQPIFTAGYLSIPADIQIANELLWWWYIMFRSVKEMERSSESKPWFSIAIPSEDLGRYKRQNITQEVVALHFYNKSYP